MLWTESTRRITLFRNYDGRGKEWGKHCVPLLYREGHVTGMGAFRSFTLSSIRPRLTPAGPCFSADRLNNCVQYVPCPDALQGTVLPLQGRQDWPGSPLPQLLTLPNLLNGGWKTTRGRVLSESARLFRRPPRDKRWAQAGAEADAEAVPRRGRGGIGRGGRGRPRRGSRSGGGSRPPWQETAAGPPQAQPGASRSALGHLGAHTEPPAETPPLLPAPAAEGRQPGPRLHTRTAHGGAGPRPATTGPRARRRGGAGGRAPLGRSRRRRCRLPAP